MDKQQLDGIWEDLGYGLGKGRVGCRFLRVDEQGKVVIAGESEAVRRYIGEFLLKFKEIGVVDGYDVTGALQRGLSITQVLFNLTSVLVLEPKQVIGADGEQGVKQERSLVTLNKEELQRYGVSLSEAQEVKFKKQVKVNDEVSDLVVIPRVTLSGLGSNPKVSLGSKQKALVSGMEIVPSRMFVGYIKALKELSKNTSVLKLQYRKSNGQLRTQYITSNIDVLVSFYGDSGLVTDTVTKYIDLMSYTDGIAAVRGLWDVPDLLLGKQGKTLTRKVSLVGIESVTEATQEEYMKLKELTEYDLSRVVGVSSVYLGKMTEDQLKVFKQDWKLEESLRLDQLIDELGNLEMKYTTDFKTMLLKYMLSRPDLFIGVEELLRSKEVVQEDTNITDLDLLYHVGY